MDTQKCFPFWTECKQGWYGVDCTQQFVKHCRESTACNYVTGQCDEGCDVEWTGAFCNKGSFSDLKIYIVVLKSGQIKLIILWYNLSLFFYISSQFSVKDFWKDTKYLDQYYWTCV